MSLQADSFGCLPIPSDGLATFKFDVAMSLMRGLVHTPNVM